MHPNPVAIDDFTKFKFLSNVRFSPEGSAACFTVSSASIGKNSYSSGIWVRKDGKNRKLTAGGKESGFVWLDENTVLFPADREPEKEKTVACKYYRIHLDGGEAEPYLTFPVPVEELIPLKNGDFLAVCTVFPGYEDLYRGDKKLEKKYLKEQEENKDYEEITQVPWWWNGATFTRGAYSGLFLYRTGKKQLERLTETGMSVSSVQLSDDGKTVFYGKTDVSVPKPDFFSGSSVYALDLESRAETLLAKSSENSAIECFVPAESFLYLKISDRHNGMNTDGDFYTLDYLTHEISLCCRYETCIGSSVGSDIRHGGGISVKADGDTLYFISTVCDGAYLYKLENGIVTRVLDKEGSVDCFDVCGDSILAVALWDMRGQELYDGRGRRVSSFNTAAMRGKYVAVPEKLNCVSRGEEIHGFVLKPADFDPAKKYPVIFDIHGGPKTVYGSVYYHEMQYWAGRGCFVIFCNPAGSDGRGDFMDIMGKYGTIDYEDLMTFCDAALNAWPQMDRENLFETGGSYGGFMTNWIIGHTDRFRACASQRSISDWISFYGVSDIGPDFAEDQNRTAIWPDVSEMWDRSPMKYADRVKTPTLFIHSFEDYRCPVDQGYQMYSALVCHGVESKMVLFRGENHELSRSGKPKHRVKRLEEITQWFETHKV